MKKKEFLTGLLFVFLSGGIIHAQQNSSELKLSLKEAQDYAIQNNKLMITSRMDVACFKSCSLGNNIKCFTSNQCIRIIYR